MQDFAACGVLRSEWMPVSTQTYWEAEYFSGVSNGSCFVGSPCVWSVMHHTSRTCMRSATEKPHRSGANLYLSSTAICLLSTSRSTVAIYHHLVRALSTMQIPEHRKMYFSSTLSRGLQTLSLLISQSPQIALLSIARVDRVPSLTDWGMLCSVQSFLWCVLLNLMLAETRNRKCRETSYSVSRSPSRDFSAPRADLYNAHSVAVVETSG